MDIEKIKEIVDNPSEHPNKDLIGVADELYREFEKTKQTALKLSNYMDYISDLYNKVGVELKNRNIPENE